jgi:GntR family transcriptional regulator / MocR family aminotransferase
MAAARPAEPDSGHIEQARLPAFPPPAYAGRLVRAAAVLTLPIALDRSGAAGLQEQIAESLRGALTAGTLLPGARLPSTRELTASLHVSRTTVAFAVQKLVDEGLLVARERSGVFVAPSERQLSPLASAGATSALRLSSRGEDLASEALLFSSRRPRAFRLSRPALELFPIREWNRLLAKHASRITLSQLDYEAEVPELQAAVAALVSSTRGARIEPGQVLLFSGSQRALQFAATCLLAPGDRAWMEDPGYPGARQALRASGARVVSRPLDGEGISLTGGGARRPRLIYVTPSNQFPLGGAMSLARRRELLAFADGSDACIVEDDYDVEFSTAGAELPSLAALDGAGRVLHVGSFSRTTVPALRIGYLVAPIGVAPALRAARTALEDPLPSLIQRTLAEFIASGQFVRHVRRMRKEYAARRQALVEAVGRSRILRLRSPPSGLHAVVDLPPAIDDVRASEAAAVLGIEAVPLSRFCASVRLPPALVLGTGTVRPQDMADAVRTLAKAVAQCRPSRRR